MIKFHAVVLEPKFFGLFSKERELVVYGPNVKTAINSILTNNPRFQIKVIWG